MRPVTWHLAQLVERRGLTATELARQLERVGVPRSLAQVSRLIAGPPRRLTIDVLAGLCQVLGCSVADLLAVPSAPTGERAELPPEVHL